MEPWVPREQKRFTPHLTLARVKRTDRQLTKDLASLPEGMKRCQMGTWQAREMDLMQSEPLPEGACHTRLAGFPLAAAV